MKTRRILFSTKHYGGLPLSTVMQRNYSLEAIRIDSPRCPALFKGLTLLAFHGSSYPQWCAVRKSQAESFRGQYRIDFKFCVAWWSICPLYPYDWHVSSLCVVHPQKIQSPPESHSSKVVTHQKITSAWCCIPMPWSTPCPLFSWVLCYLRCSQELFLQWRINFERVRQILHSCKFY